MEERKHKINWISNEIKSSFKYVSLSISQLTIWVNMRNEIKYNGNKNSFKKNFLKFRNKK